MIGRKINSKRIVTIFPQEWCFSQEHGISTCKDSFFKNIKPEKVTEYIEELRTAADWLEESMKDYETQTNRS